MKVEADFPYDPVLPQLPMVLDADAMRKTFQNHLFKNDGHFRVEACSIERVKYKPGQNCLICYQLKIMDERTQTLQEQGLCTRIYEAGGTTTRLKKALTVKGVAPKFGLPVSRIPALEMVIWAFPNDRKLQGMHKISDPDFLKNTLLPAYLKGSAITRVSAQLVHYVPEHTCTVRVELQSTQAEKEEEGSHTLYGKTYYNNDGREVFQWMTALWQSASRQSGQLRMAQAIGYDEATKSLWQTSLCGVPLLDVALQSPRFEGLLKEAASTVAHLHTTAISGLSRVCLKDLLIQLEAVKQLLSQGRPGLMLTLSPLIDRLRTQAASHWSEASATLHGDLHLNNFFVEDEKIALIDMDNLCQGPPLLDVGSFLAGIMYRGILCDLPSTQIETMAQVFVRQYAQLTPWAVPKSALRWYTAMMLINERAFRCLTRLKAGRLDILDQLIMLADRMSLAREDDTGIYPLGRTE